MIKHNKITIPQLAEMLGISRIAVYKKVRKGQIPARKVGRIYVISDSQVASVLGRGMTTRDKQQITRAVDMTVRQYGLVLKMLAKD